ncbi:kelch-like protein 28 [Agrilus planipennis]|uniref:Kelch-like protein 28 n=1 Tax=Agrilus planipennis TaxID=224129 RepID=A0A7F5RMK9_AGRPL|nr:kelch-like protein 28 [Agrilus planipennis]
MIDYFSCRMDGEDYTRDRNKCYEQKCGIDMGSDLGDMNFMMIDYIKEAMKAMAMMRGHQMLTDVTLEVGQELYHAHKVVLAAGSPYFKAMFTGGLKECEMKRIKLQGVSATAMALLINFMYTGRIRVNENTVCQLLPAATMFQVSYF